MWDAMSNTYDYIVVGAGTAGCVVANVLSSKPGNKVLLIESGRQPRDIMITMPAGFPFVSSSAKYNWGYQSEPEPGLDGRRLSVLRGRLLGGSSAINAMAFVRGHPLDYEDWAQLAGGAWSWQSCLEAFKAIETFTGGSSELRGSDGPLPVQEPRYSNPLYEIYLRAAAEAGYPLSANPNGPQPEGFGPMDQTIRDGRRVSAADAFIGPVRNRRNLIVSAATDVLRLAFQNGRAQGVRVRNQNGQEQTILGRNIVLSAGAINTPKLLMSSGIGPGAALQRHGIAVRLDRREIGRNLQDHVDVTVKQECRLPVSESKSLSLPGRLKAGLEWLLFRRGAGATNHCELVGYVHAGGSDRRPDIQLCFLPLMAHFDGTAVSTGHGFQATVFLLRPNARGSVELRDADPASPPVIRYNHLTDRDDVSLLLEGLKIQRRIFAQPAFAAYAGREFSPGPQAQSDRQIEEFMRATGKSTNHPCGTCRMGLDGESALDPQGLLRGAENVWVADASAMPRITSGNINAPIAMLAYKIASRLAGA